MQCPNASLLLSNHYLAPRKTRSLLVMPDKTGQLTTETWNKITSQPS